MIHHWKGLDLDTTDIEYRHESKPSGETITSQTSSP